MKFLKPGKILGSRNSFFANLSLKNRLWLFQIVVVLIILACIFTIAGSSGIVADLSENPYHSLYSDLKDSETELSNKCLTISNCTVELAKKLDKSIQKQLTAKGLEPSQLKDNPHLLAGILSAEVEKACFSMEKAGVTGVFLFLDATVNPVLERAKDSKAGFFIVNMNPNPLPYENQQLFLLYGPVQLARENNMHLHTQWELELNVAPNTLQHRGEFYNRPFEAALMNIGENIFNLGYWNPFYIPAEDTDKVISFSVPLMDKAGNPYGVCGLELSMTALENILRQKSSPEFEREVLLFSTQNDANINMNIALICGSNSSWLENGKSEFLHTTTASESTETFKDYYFTTPTKDKILGCNVKARLYPGKSVFKEENWTLTLLLPRSDVTAKSARLYYALAQLLLLFIASIFITYFTSRYCISPLLEAIKKLKDNDPQIKTNITEIDDLIEFLKERSEAPIHERMQESTPMGKSTHEHSGFYSATAALSTVRTAAINSGTETSSLSQEQYSRFESQLTTLSNAERKIFDLYIKGHDAKEICKMLYISINTLKTHNRRIYTKMNVSSRAELLKYCNELMGRL